MAWDKSKDELRDQVVRQTNKRKKTAKWCRGKVGVEHVTEIVVNHNWQNRTACGWRELFRYTSFTRDKEHWRWHYSCKHSYKCVNCGKYTEFFLKNNEECPDYQPRVE